MWKLRLRKMWPVYRKISTARQEPRRARVHLGSISVQGAWDPPVESHGRPFGTCSLTQAPVSLFPPCCNGGKEGQCRGGTGQLGRPVDFSWANACSPLKDDPVAKQEEGAPGDSLGGGGAHRDGTPMGDLDLEASCHSTPTRTPCQSVSLFAQCAWRRGQHTPKLLPLMVPGL